MGRLRFESCKVVNRPQRCHWVNCVLVTPLVKTRNITTTTTKAPTPKHRQRAQQQRNRTQGIRTAIGFAGVTVLHPSHSSSKSALSLHACTRKDERTFLSSAGSFEVSQTLSHCRRRSVGRWWFGLACCVGWFIDCVPALFCGRGRGPGLRSAGKQRLGGHTNTAGGIWYVFHITSINKRF